MRKLHTELEIFHQPANRNPFLLYFLLVLRYVSLRFRMQPLCIDEEQRQKTIKGWVTAAHRKIACLLTMAVLLVLLLIFITLYVSRQRLCGAQKGKTFQERCLVGKLPKCCKTTSYRCWQFTVALITPCSFLWKGILSFLRLKRLADLHFLYFDSLGHPCANYCGSCATIMHQSMQHIRYQPPLPPFAVKSGLIKEKSRPSNAENVELFQWGLALLFQSTKRLVCSRAQIIIQHLVPHT